MRPDSQRSRYQRHRAGQSGAKHALASAAVLAASCTLTAGLLTPVAIAARDPSASRPIRGTPASALATIARVAKKPKTRKAAATPENTLVVEGAGDGHGVGMSQWGALGYAEHGWTADQIVTHYYTGTAIGHVSKKTIVKVLVGSHVEKIPIEKYVRGVVAAEMPASWPAAALEAQAIASRTFALTDDAGGTRFEVYSDTRSQVYLGKAAETPQSNAAVKATEGDVVTYGGAPAITFFFASSGGQTEDVQNVFAGSLPEPWLVSVSDPYDGGPLHRWKASVSFAKAANQLSGLVDGSFEGIEVIRRGISPRVLAAYVLGSKGKTEVSGAELEERLGLYSTWVYFSLLSPNGKLKREPDLSGSPPSATETAPESGSEPPPTTSPEASPSGGTGASSPVQSGGGVGAP